MEFYDGGSGRGNCISRKSKELNMLKEIRENLFKNGVQSVVILREVNEIKVRKLRNLNVVISFLCNTRHKKGKLCCLEIIFILPKTMLFIMTFLREWTIVTLSLPDFSFYMAN